MNELLLTIFIYLFGTCENLGQEMEAHGIQSVSEVFNPNQADLIRDVCGYE